MHRSFKPLSKQNVKSAVRFQNGRYTGHTKRQNYEHCLPCKFWTNTSFWLRTDCGWQMSLFMWGWGFISPVSLLFEDQIDNNNQTFFQTRHLCPLTMTPHIHPSMAVTLSVRVKRPFSVHVHWRLSVSGCCCCFFLCILIWHNMWCKNLGKMKNIYTTTLSVTA